ncbi:hypothetical protein ACFXJ8_42160 [Nonomuraea sp. NPDC059194]|uniref:hypothetical protein n=1 Tax=Nonomuraea sp. NPDC059194 TaxID=3346764 RepID=UPI00367C24A4
MAEQSEHQRRAYELLGVLLARAAREDLPVIAWTMSSAQSEPILAGHCDAVDPIQRQDDFEAWRSALGAEAWPNGIKQDYGIRLHASVADQEARVTVTLAAEIRNDEM